MKICYVFTGGRKERLNSAKKPPDDFFYGYTQLQYDKKIVQQADFTEWVQSKSKIHSILCKLFLLLHLNYSFLRTILANRNKFADSDIIILTTNSQGDHFSFLKIAGFFRGKKLIVIPMGLYSRNLPTVSRLILPILYSRTVLLPISREEEIELNNKLFLSKVIYLPFGVDQDFWTIGKINKNNQNQQYILSIGNDTNRDYEQLLSIWKPEFPLLKIITSLPMPTALPYNIEVISGDWRTNLIFDEGIREYFRNSLFVIIPLKETSQPAGQSAALQAMACGKAVILSRISGLWDRKYLKHMEVCYLVEPYDPEGMIKAIRFFKEYPEQAQRIGANARHLIEARYNTKNLATYLEATIKEITSIGID
jgi:glycosyltransferase involved in cell wall biosynthesis